jgi:hypothetical protein
MADKRISQLVERVTLANNDVFPIVASGATTTNKVTLQTIDDYMQTNLDFGVTSVAISVPTGLSVTGTPVTSTGTFVVTFTAGYSIPTNAKQTEWDTAYNLRITSATAPLGIASNVISITQSGASSNGYLSSTDWNTFNSKQNALTFGNLTEDTSSVLTITGGTGSVIGSGTTIQVKQATSSQDGFLDSADWTTFNNKQNALSGTGIVKSTGGTITYLTDNTSNWDSAYNDKINSASVTGTTTKTLTLNQQDGGTITTTWTDLDTGTVTSVGVSMPSAFSVANSPITSSGTISITGAGTISQYIDGTGALQTFPSLIAQATNLVREVYNNSGATMTKGTVVYINGGQGNLPTIAKALATGDSTSAQTYGVVQNSIGNMSNGYIVVVGDLIDMDTQAFVEGTQLYLSPTTAGEYTSTKQYAPNHLVYVGIVTRSHPTQGIIAVKIQNGYEMDELHNVSAQSPNNNDILQYKTATGLWTKTAGTTSNIAEGSNLYYTDARSRAAISESVTGLDYNSSTGVLSTTTGYAIPTTASQTNWDAAYNDKINSAAVSGTTTKTLTLTQQDGGTITASWTDINTDAVSSVFGRTGAVVATSGDYNTDQVTEGSSNLYFTNARSRSSITLTTTGTSGVATYNSTTGALNIPNYTYTLPTASTSVLGGVKVDGTTITINGSGVISGANTYTLPVATASVLGGVKIGTGVNVDVNGVISVSTNYQAPITLTTTGSSGAATLVGSTLNIPNYSFSETDTLQSVILRNGTTNTGFVIENGNSTYSTPASTNVPVIYMHNTSSNANAHAVLSLRTLGPTGGDPFISLDINGVLGWSVGVDNSDGDKFKIGKSWAEVGTNTYFTIDTSGNSAFSNSVTIQNGDLTIKNTSFGGTLYLEAADTTDKWLLYHYNPDKTLRFNYNGAGGDEFIMNTNGATTFSNSVTASSLIKSGGTSSQFLKADGSVDSNTYLTSYTETDTLQTVTNRGSSSTNALFLSNGTPFTFTANGATGTYNQTTLYVNQNNTSGATANGIFLERGRLTDSGSAEVRQFVIGARGGQIQWRLDGVGNTEQSGGITTGGNIIANSGRILAQTGGNNTYGVFSGYGANSNHMMVSRADITGPTATPTFSAGHQMCFVEYAGPNDTEGWFFKTSATTNYTEVARITRAGINWNGYTVWHSGNDGSGSGLDADLLDGRDSGGYMTQLQGGFEFQTGSYTGWYKIARSSEAGGGAGLRGGFKIIVAATGNYLTPTQDVITGFKDWTTTAVITSIECGNNSIFQDYRITYDSNYSYLEGYVSYYFGGSQSIYISSLVHGLNGLTWTPYTGTVQASSTSSGAVSIGKVGTGLVVPYLRSGGGIFTGITEFSGVAGDEVGLVRITNTQSGNGIHFPALQVINVNGNHSYGIVAEFRVSNVDTGDRPSILFSRASGPNWAIGMGAFSGSSDRFGIGYKSTYLLDSWPSMRMDMDTSGNVTFSGDVTAFSDARLKTDVQVIDNAIEKVKQIRGVTFKRNDEIDHNVGRKHTGVIAQEVLNVLPEVVSMSDTGMYNVAYGNMVGLLVEAIKEQQKEIDELKKQIA